MSESEDNTSEASEPSKSNEVSIQPKTTTVRARPAKTVANTSMPVSMPRLSTESKTSEKQDTEVKQVNQRHRRSMGKVKRDENGDELCVQIVPKLCVEIVPKFAPEPEKTEEPTKESDDDVKEEPIKKGTTVSDKVSDNTETKESLRGRPSAGRLKEATTGKAAAKTEKPSEKPKETTGKVSSPALPRGRPRQAVILPAAELEESSGDEEEGEGTVQVMQRTLRNRGAKANEDLVEKKKETKTVKEKPTETLETKPKDLPAVTKLTRRSLKSTQEDLKTTQDEKDDSLDSKTEDSVETKVEKRRSGRTRKQSVDSQVSETKTAKAVEDQNEELVKVEVKMPTKRGILNDNKLKTDDSEVSKPQEISKDNEVPTPQEVPKDIVEKVDEILNEAVKDEKTELKTEKKEIVDINEEAVKEIDKHDIKDKKESPEKDQSKEGEKPVAEVSPKPESPPKPETPRKRPGRPRKQENVQGPKDIKKTIPDPLESSGAKTGTISKADDASESPRKTGRRLPRTGRWTGPYPDDDFVSGAELSDLEEKPDSVVVETPSKELTQTTEPHPKRKKSISPHKAPESPKKESPEKVPPKVEESVSSEEIVNWEDTPPVIIKDSLPSHILSAPNLFNYHHYPVDLELGPCKVVLTKLEVSPEEAVRRLKMIEMMMQSKHTEKPLIENVPEEISRDQEQKGKEVSEMAEESNKEIAKEMPKESATEFSEKDVSTDTKVAADSAGADQEVPTAKTETPEKEEPPKKRRGRPPGKKKANEVGKIKYI